MKVFQQGFNYSQDGDGNRLVYHLQGCNMKCPWCANPEGMDFSGALVADSEWLLDEICPHGAVSDHRVDRMICAECEDRACITEHRTKGMRLSYTEMTVDEIVRAAISSRPMFYEGGGVTFTGGEATGQFEALKEALTRLHEAGIHTCIETNGTHPRLAELFPVIDQLIMDCKSCDEDKHLHYTGMPMASVNANLRLAAEKHPNLHVRVPLIGGVNDSDEDREKFLKFFDEIKGENVTFEVLAYHEYGKKKWAECGYMYKMTEDARVSAESLKAIREGITAIGGTYKRT
ncbi:MAG: glycyl-radical enzyme activating protein [Clostridia bacterium]|nr:glycyl-radical enzyme activating protein [Clostridia bacterium]